MRIRYLLAVLLLGALAAPSQADIWSPSTWIPFSKNKSKQVGVGKSSKKSQKSKLPSFSGLPATAHDFLARSKGVMAAHGNTSSEAQASQKRHKAGEKPSRFKSMFESEPPKEPRTVVEWMAQKRPQP